MQLQLTEPERLELVSLVREAYSETNPELHRAMNHEHRESIRARRGLLETLLKRLEPAALATA